MSKASEYQKKWNAEHPEGYSLYKAKRRESRRRNRLGVTIGSKLVMVEAPGKRPYPEGQKCELCGKGPRLLGYHHWDNSDFSKGLWLCRPCHVVAGKVESGWVERYLELKEAVQKEVLQ